MRQTTITPEGQTRQRRINDQKFIEILVQLLLLKQCGEDVEIHTNASEKNGYTWNRITVIRKMGNRGYTTTIFDKIITFDNDG